MQRENLSIVVGLVAGSCSCRLTRLRTQDPASETRRAAYRWLAVSRPAHFQIMFTSPDVASPAVRHFPHGTDITTDSADGSCWRPVLSPVSLTHASIASIRRAGQGSFEDICMFTSITPLSSRPGALWGAAEGLGRPPGAAPSVPSWSPLWDLARSQRDLARDRSPRGVPGELDQRPGSWGFRRRKSSSGSPGIAIRWAWEECSLATSRRLAIQDDRGGSARFGRSRNAGPG